MASPARRMASTESPPVDLRPTEEAYRAHRARRRAKAHHARSQQLAARRFVLLLLLLVLCSAFLIVAVWSTLQSLFGF